MYNVYHKLKCSNTKRAKGWASAQNKSAHSERTQIQHIIQKHVIVAVSQKFIRTSLNIAMHTQHIEVQIVLNKSNTLVDHKINHIYWFASTLNLSRTHHSMHKTHISSCHCGADRAWTQTRQQLRWESKQKAAYTTDMNKVRHGHHTSGRHWGEQAQHTMKKWDGRTAPFSKLSIQASAKGWSCTKGKMRESEQDNAQKQTAQYVL